jgi:FkbM family methyltransferase
MFKNPSAFSIKLLRKIKIPSIRKFLLKHAFKKNGLILQDLLSYDNDRFFIYKVDNVFLPDESFYWPLSFESKLLKCRNESLFAYEPKIGDTILDIGAGLGEETILFSRLAGETGKVISVEANPVVHKILCESIRLNELTNVDANNVAIYRENTIAGLSAKDASYEAAFISFEEMDKGARVKTTRMDSFINEKKIERIDLLKVNIEGSERFVLETLSPEQFSVTRHAAIACHDFRYRKEGIAFFQTKEYIKQQLVNHGFEIITRNTGIDYLDDWVYATNKSLS